MYASAKDTADKSQHLKPISKYLYIFFFENINLVFRLGYQMAVLFDWALCMAENESYF